MRIDIFYTGIFFNLMPNVNNLEVVVSQETIISFAVISNLYLSHVLSIYVLIPCSDFNSYCFIGSHLVSSIISQL